MTVIYYMTQENTTDTKKHAGGAPTKYGKLDYLHVVQMLAQLGHIDTEICDVLDITEPTLNRYKKEHPEFFKSLKDGKSIADANVMVAGYHRAMGYSHPEEKIFCSKDGEVTRVMTTRHYPPDTTAFIYWTKNRMPEHFRDKQDVNHTGNIAVTNGIGVDTEKL